MDKFSKILKRMELNDVITESLNTFTYNLPENRKQRLFDFYTFSSLSPLVTNIQSSELNVIKTYESVDSETENEEQIKEPKIAVRGARKLNQNFVDSFWHANDKCYIELANAMMDDILYCISAEFKHINQDPDYQNLNKIPDVLSIDIYSNYIKGDLPNFKVPNKKGEENNSSYNVRYEKTIKSIAKAGGSILDFAKLCSYVYDNFKFNGAYAGPKWADAANAFIGIANAIPKKYQPDSIFKPLKLSGGVEEPYVLVFDPIENPNQQIKSNNDSFADFYTEYNKATTEQRVQIVKLRQLLIDYIAGEKFPLDIMNKDTGDFIIPANKKIDTVLIEKLIFYYNKYDVDPSPIKNRLEEWFLPYQTVLDAVYGGKNGPKDEEEFKNDTKKITNFWDLYDKKMKKTDSNVIKEIHKMQNSLADFLYLNKFPFTVLGFDDPDEESTTIIKGFENVYSENIFKLMYYHDSFVVYSADPENQKQTDVDEFRNKLEEIFGPYHSILDKFYGKSSDSEKNDDVPSEDAEETPEEENISTETSPNESYELTPKERLALFVAIDHTWGLSHNTGPTFNKLIEFKKLSDDGAARWLQKSLDKRTKDENLFRFINARKPKDSDVSQQMIPIIKRVVYSYYGATNEEELYKYVAKTEPKKVIPIHVSDVVYRNIKSNPLGYSSTGKTAENVEFKSHYNYWCTLKFNVKDTELGIDYIIAAHFTDHSVTVVATDNNNFQFNREGIMLDGGYVETKKTSQQDINLSDVYGKALSDTFKKIKKYGGVKIDPDKTVVLQKLEIDYDTIKKQINFNSDATFKRILQYGDELVLKDSGMKFQIGDDSLDFIKKYSMISFVNAERPVDSPDKVLGSPDAEDYFAGKRKKPKPALGLPKIKFSLVSNPDVNMTFEFRDDFSTDINNIIYGYVYEMSRKAKDSLSKTLKSRIVEEFNFSGENPVTPQSINIPKKYLKYIDYVRTISPTEVDLTNIRTDDIVVKIKSNNTRLTNPYSVQLRFQNIPVTNKIYNFPDFDFIKNNLENILDEMFNDIKPEEKQKFDEYKENIDKKGKLGEDINNFLSANYLSVYAEKEFRKYVSEIVKDENYDDISPYIQYLMFFVRTLIIEESYLKQTKMVPSLSISKRKLTLNKKSVIFGGLLNEEYPFVYEYTFGGQIRLSYGEVNADNPIHELNVDNFATGIKNMLISFVEFSNPQATVKPDEIEPKQEETISDRQLDMVINGKIDRIRRSIHGSGMSSDIADKIYNVLMSTFGIKEHIHQFVENSTSVIKTIHFFLTINISEEDIVTKISKSRFSMIFDKKYGCILNLHPTSNHNRNLIVGPVFNAVQNPNMVVNQYVDVGGYVQYGMPIQGTLELNNWKFLFLGKYEILSDFQKYLNIDQKSTTNDADTDQTPQISLDNIISQYTQSPSTKNQLKDFYNKIISHHSLSDYDHVLFQENIIKVGFFADKFLGEISLHNKFLNFQLQPYNINSFILTYDLDEIKEYKGSLSFFIIKNEFNPELFMQYTKGKVLFQKSESFEKSESLQKNMNQAWSNLLSFYNDTLQKINNTVQESFTLSDLIKTFLLKS